MALSDTNLRNVVKPHLLKEFDDSLNNHCGELDYNPSLQMRCHFYSVTASTEMNFMMLELRGYLK